MELKESFEGLLVALSLFLGVLGGVILEYAQFLPDNLRGYVTTVGGVLTAVSVAIVGWWYKYINPAAKQTSK